MSALCSLFNLLVFIQIATCRDFYLGMFRRNDFLVAQDVIYKAPSPFGYTTANYGRVFKCPITYFRVVDRLGMGRGPITTIVRGGLRKKFITVRIKSTYRLPVSVNIYVGCENKKPTTLRTTTKATTTEAVDDGYDDDATTVTDIYDDTTATDGPTTADKDESGDIDITIASSAHTEKTIHEPEEPEEEAIESDGDATEPGGDATESGGDATESETAEPGR